MLRMTLKAPEGPLSTPRMSDLLRGISLQYGADTLAAATKGWHSSLRLGSGSYGAVYKGELEDGSEVAIKVIDLKAVGAHGQDPEMAGFDDEVKTLSKFRHPNLVTLLGWGKEDHYRYLVYELLSGGDAFQRLHACKASKGTKQFLWYQRLSVMLDAASGLSHMHNSTPKAFHRDIKAANILLDRHGQAKMADFGLSCTASGLKGDQHVKVKVVSGTPGYACPIYARTGRVTEASEVYSLGMVMLELLTSIPPATGHPNGGIIYPIMTAIRPGQSGDLERCLESLDKFADWPSALSQELAALALRCANPNDEASRPRFVQLVQSIRMLTKRFPSPGSDESWMSRSPQHLLLPPCTEEGRSSAGSLSPSAGAGSGQAATFTEAPFFFEVVEAAGLSVSSLPAHLKRLPLTLSPGTTSGQYIASVGRQHQPEMFEAWMTEPELLQCISRTAFEIHWTQNSPTARLVLKGANAVAVDGQIPARTAEGTTIKIGSEVGFPYSSTGELEFFLRLRVAAQEEARSGSQLAAQAQATAPLPRAPQKASESAVPSSFKLIAIVAEGHSAEELSHLAPEQRSFDISRGSSVVVGRQHQASKFDALLGKATGCLSFISRSHMQVEAAANGVKVTNQSLNPVYINDREPLFKGDSRTLARDELLSFARLDGQNHVVFLTLQVVAVA